jgi:hypothetical protein
VTLERVLAKNWAAEEVAGFPRLSRMPSTGVRKFLRYYRGLPGGERGTLQEALVSRGLLAFGAQPGPLDGAEATAYEAWVRQGLMGDHGLDSFSLRMARNMISAAKNEPEMAQVMARFPPAELERIAATASATAPMLRKKIEPLLRAGWGLAGRNSGGGVWYYEDTPGGMRVMVDYGGRTQLRYWVRPAPVGPIRATMVSLEGAFGLIQDWDWITADGADDAAALLAESVAACVDLVERAAS